MIPMYQLEIGVFITFKINNFTIRPFFMIKNNLSFSFISFNFTFLTTHF